MHRSTNVSAFLLRERNAVNLLAISIFGLAFLFCGRQTGRLVDRVCTRIGYAVALSFWTLASISHYFAGMHAVAGALHESMAMLGRLLQHVPGVGSGHWVAQMENLAGAVIGLAIARFALGVGQAGNFPAAIKAVAEWFRLALSVISRDGKINCGCQARFAAPATTCKAR